MIHLICPHFRLKHLIFSFFFFWLNWGMKEFKLTVKQVKCFKNHYILFILGLIWSPFHWRHLNSFVHELIWNTGSYCFACKMDSTFTDASFLCRFARVCLSLVLFFCIFHVRLVKTQINAFVVAIVTAAYVDADQKKEFAHRNHLDWECAVRFCCVLYSSHSGMPAFFLFFFFARLSWVNKHKNFASSMEKKHKFTIH